MSFPKTKSGGDPAAPWLTPSPPTQPRDSCPGLFWREWLRFLAAAWCCAVAQMTPGSSLDGYSIPIRAPLRVQAHLRAHGGRRLRDRRCGHHPARPAAPIGVHLTEAEFAAAKCYTLREEIAARTDPAAVSAWSQKYTVDAEACRELLAKRTARAAQ